MPAMAEMQTVDEMESGKRGEAWTCGCESTTWLWKAGLLTSIVGLAFYVVGFSTEYMAVLDNVSMGNNITGGILDVHLGLWRRCIEIKINGTVIQNFCEDLENDHRYQTAGKALSCIGFIFCVFGILSAFCAAVLASRLTTAAGGSLLVFGSIISFVGFTQMGINAHNSDDRLGVDYSTFLFVIGVFLMMAGGGMLLWTLRSSYTAIK